MKILVISNLYPPYYIGGYELVCHEIVEALKSQSHEVKVLTSVYKTDKPIQEGNVYRWLKSDFGKKNKNLIKKIIYLFKKEMINQKATIKLLKSFKPDVVYIWNLNNISVSIAFLMQNMEYPIVYSIGDDWLSRWEDDPWYFLFNHCSKNKTTQFFKNIFHYLSKQIIQIPTGQLNLNNVQFVSNYLKEFTLRAGKPVKNAEIIYRSKDIQKFPLKDSVNNPKRLLYVGQVIPHKGVHTLIEAMNIIVKEYNYSSIRLTIVGGGIYQDYLTKIKKMMRNFGLEENIAMTGFIDQKDLPKIYREHDIFLFPSVWDEPSGGAILEAMASGLAVVGTATGGSAEIMQNEFNSLIFPKEDASGCARQILRLLNDSTLFEKIRHNGRRTVEERFEFSQMVGKIENSLNTVFRKTG